MSARSLPRLAVAIGTLTAACEATAPMDVICQPYVAPGISAGVYDVRTGASAVGALVTASDGDFLDSARITLSQPLVALAYERAGVYAVSASLSGYATLVARAQVTADRCHVVTVPLSFYLGPAGP